MKEGRLKVLMTGVCGRIGQKAVPEFVQRFDCRFTDIRPYPGEPPAEFIQADLADYEAMLRCCEGMDAVVHLGGYTGRSQRIQYYTGPNIVGVYNVFEAATQQGVKRVVFASTRGIVRGYGMNPKRVITADMPVRPNNVYAATKVFGEALGRCYSDQRGLSVICIRIANFARYPAEVGRVNRGILTGWISPPDLTQLLWRAVVAPEDIRFGIFFGLSKNTRLFYDIQAARNLLGYDPQDNPEEQPWEFEEG